jgi:hypothetical protein
VALHSLLLERRRRAHAAVASALQEVHADNLDEAAALLGHHREEAGDAIDAARWHRRAAEWAGLNDLKAALYHWQRVRELARQGGNGAESAALMVVACTQALSHGWRMGAASEEWEELFKEGCVAAERTADLAALAMLNRLYAVVRGLNQGIANDWVRYSREAVRIADCTNDNALRCGIPDVFAPLYCGRLREAERVAGEVIEIAHEDPHFGARIAGSSPLVSAQLIRLVCIGRTSDPAKFLRESPRVRQFALDSGYPEQAVWVLYAETEFKCFLDNCDGILALAQAAVRLAENVGIANQIFAALALCYALACHCEWHPLLDAAMNTLGIIRERGAIRALEPNCLAHIGTAQIELGNLEAGRAAAQEGVVFMRESKFAWNPKSYAVLVRAQLALGEPAADITSTLDEYAALLEFTEFHLLEGEMHELRARLADREGRHTEKVTSLQRAFNCYTRFGMVAQTARIKEAMSSA